MNYQHSTAVPLEGLLPEITDILDSVIDKYAACMGLVSSADKMHSHILTFAYCDVFVSSNQSLTILHRLSKRNLRFSSNGKHH